VSWNALDRSLLYGVGLRPSAGRSRSYAPPREVGEHSASASPIVRGRRPVERHVGALSTLRRLYDPKNGSDFGKRDAKGAFAVKLADEKRKIIEKSGLMMSLATRGPYSGAGTSRFASGRDDPLPSAILS
jgi:hypothetical protein